MPSVSSVSKGPSTSQSIGGRPYAWAGPNNVSGSDNLRASVFVTSQYTQTDKLWTTNYGFSIPACANVCGVHVEFEYANGTTRTDNLAIRYVLAGIETGSTVTANLPPTGGIFVDSVASGATATFTPTQINDSTFGVRFEVRTVVTGANMTLFTDSVKLIVQYVVADAGIDVRTSEYDHEIRSVSINTFKNSFPDVSEYDHEITSTDITQTHTFTSQTSRSEYDFEIRSVALSNSPFVGVASSEYDHELLSVALTQIFVFRPQSSEYDHEMQMASLQAHENKVFSSEYDHEIKSVAVQANGPYSVVVQSAEIDFEIKSAQIYNPNLTGARSEYDHEIRSTYLTFGNILDARSSEYGEELGSPGLRRFRSTPDSKRIMTIERGNRKITIPYASRTHTKGPYARVHIIDQGSRVHQKQLMFYRDLK